MTDLQKDVLNGLAFMTGVIGFLSGEFIISSTLFAGTAIASNININRKRSQKTQDKLTHTQRRM